METNDRLSKDDELRAENALKALQIELNYNAETFIGDNAPPEIISRWLDSIARFEEAHANANLITMHSLIGSPELMPPDHLDEAAAEAEINRLLLLLFEQSVYVSRPEGAPALDFYRFLIEEFLQLEIPDVKLPGMMHVFHYNGVDEGE